MAIPLPVPAPARTPENDQFWNATADGHLLLAQCDECATVIWYPRALCQTCGSLSVSWIEASGQGVVYSFTVVHRNSGSFGGTVPYVLAYVELAEGPRVLTNVVGCDPETVHIGQPVRVAFFDTGEGSALYRFEPAEEP